ncbi:MAG: Glc operon transcriptional activator [Paracidovorax wautersii]|uniref:Glc operon transcriptional activator n=1 Tax=Paracidovorax wautersii TaxID=1177982 RepID=A0A7V8JQ73_9BURK|nr:MAG: Glc operon transcriptional activator [Paracidovorax wautersii]
MSVSFPDPTEIEAVAKSLAGDGPAVPAAASQAMKAQLQLRELILSGELPARSRLTEVAVVERLGVSRTPVRTALLKLEDEGLIEPAPGGGYSVCAFHERDIADAIELRGTLEGLLARLAAERGVARKALEAARDCLRRIDAALAPATLDDAHMSAYGQLNDAFHDHVRAMADSPVIARQLERACRLPFASPSAFVIIESHRAPARDMLTVAQSQHWQVLDAIEAREGSRAEAIMREHSRIARRNLQRALQAPGAAAVPGGVGLIQRQGGKSSL